MRLIIGSFLLCVFCFVAGLAIALYVEKQEEAYQREVADYEVLLVEEAITSYRDTVKSAQVADDGTTVDDGPLAEEVITGFRRRLRNDNYYPDSDEGEYSPAPAPPRRGILNRPIRPFQGYLMRAGKGLWVLVTAGFACLILAACVKKLFLN